MLGSSERAFPGNIDEIGLPFGFVQIHIDSDFKLQIAILPEAAPGVGLHLPKSPEPVVREEPVLADIRCLPAIWLVIKRGLAL